VYSIIIDDITAFEIDVVHRKYHYDIEQGGFMKTLSYLLAVALVLFTLGVSFAGQFGPPEPTAKEGKPSIGIGYFYSESKMKSGNTGNLVFKSNQVYLQGTFSFVKNWEVFGRIGGADMKEQAFGFKDGMKAFGSVGVRGLLYDDGLFGFGPVIQGNIYSKYSDTTMSGSVPERLTVEDSWDGSVGLAAQIKIDKVVFYYGPFAYMARNKLKVQNDSATLKEKQNVGGFLGVNVLAIKGLNICIEGQYTGRFSVGGMVNYSF
jgi:hypothetical protein